MPADPTALRSALFRVLMNVPGIKVNFVDTTVYLSITWASKVPSNPYTS
jgi:hypothetical protein